MQESTSPLFLLVVPGFVVFFALLFTGVVFLMSRVSGWAALARAYPGPPGARPSRWRGRSAYLRFGARMQGVLNFDADGHGFTVAPIWLFRAGHAPLCIPWSDVTASEETWLLLRFVKLTFSKVPGIPMRIPMDFGRELLAVRS